MGLYLFFFVVAIIFILYAGRIIKYTLALDRLFWNDKVTVSEIDPVRVALIIPARNEHSFISDLVSDVQNQDYPGNLLDVILVDDHSTDGTAEIMKNVASGKDNFTFISLPEGQSGKKAAIEAGVKHASCDWIIQTDADCRLPQSFISAHARASLNPETAFVAGAVKYIPVSGFFEKLERLEYYSLAGVTLGSLIANKPVMCNAANMSYSRDFYLQADEMILSQQHPSGDDIFLLELAKRMGKNVGILTSKGSIVSTHGAGSFRQFLNQRVRWGSKARFYRNPEMIFVTLIIWFANLLLTSLLLGAIFFPSLFIWAGILWLAKSIIDSLLMMKITRYFDQPALMRYFPFAAVIYHFYLSAAGIFSLIGGFSWKNRNYS